jgi:hypothetical protein
VTEKKLIAWMKEEVFTHRVEPPKSARVIKPTKKELAMAEKLGIDPIKELPILLDSDRVSPKDAAASLGEEVEVDETDIIVDEQGHYLLSYKTIKVWVAAIASLHAEQIAYGTIDPPTVLRGPLLKNLLKWRREQTQTFERESFKDRGIGGVSSGLSEPDFLRLHSTLLAEAQQDPTVYWPAPIHSRQVSANTPVEPSDPGGYAHGLLPPPARRESPQDGAL